MAKKKATQKKRKNALSWQGQLILVILVLCSVLFAATSIILIAGMLPSIVAGYLDQTKEKMRGITIGAMNLAGCTPFVMHLWMTETTVDNALNILTDPLVWMIMYGAAAIGYCIEWAVVGTVSVFMGERAQVRIKSIEKQQEQLRERWGEEVSGTMPLDQYGFPLASEDEKSAPKPKKK